MIALTGEELGQAIREAIGKQGWADITVKQRYEAIAKAQLKKVVEWMKQYRHDCIECGWTITPEHEDWQALLKEVE